MFMFTTSVLDIWRQRVDDILHFVVGYSVDVMDAYRLGRYATDKVRPVLIKLRSVWDKRCILSRCSNLKQYSERGIFIAADEPIEMRRKNTFDRMKYRAERDGKRVVITGDVLSIDGKAVYSLQDGHLRQDGV